MTKRKCRVCNGPLFPSPLIRYENMPVAAQNFPDATSVAEDRGTGITVCQCSLCGLVQLLESPVPYYRDVIRSAGISAPIRAAKSEQFSAFAERYSLRGKKVMEFGCGNGEFLALWEGLGVDAWGLEHAQEAVDHCLQQGLRVVQGYMGDASCRLPHGPFDAFVLLMFLEHMPDPCASLSAMRRHLADDAVGLVEVPNFDMVVRDNVFSEFIGDHLMYFTRETFHFTLRKCGFEILESGELRDDYVLTAVVRNRRPLDLSRLNASREQLSHQLHAFIDRFPRKSVYIWGAGHQSLATICLTGIGEKIGYVVDSAPFKQDKFTPASHIPIISPDTMRHSPPAALIVMAASYSDEVAGIARKTLGGRIPMVIVRETCLETVSKESG